VRGEEKSDERDSVCDPHHAPSGLTAKAVINARARVAERDDAEQPDVHLLLPNLNRLQTPLYQCQVYQKVKSSIAH
jgi:hypothetical protein